tara:strand:+ start:254 stop:460 length:207 start_codon:yes stop_codon:yes gene_type:complete
MAEEEVIRYGAGGRPYRGNVGPHSIEAEPLVVVEEEPEEVKVEIRVEEDDTPLTDDEVVTKAKGGKKE